MGRSLKRALGRRVKEAREAMSLSQEDLADRMGRSARALSDIERGASGPPLETLELLSKHLGIPIADFFEYATDTDRQDIQRLDKETSARQVIKRLTNANLDVALKQLQALADSQDGTE